MSAVSSSRTRRSQSKSAGRHLYSETEDGAATHRPVGTRANCRHATILRNHDHQHATTSSVRSTPQPAHPHHTNRANNRPPGRASVLRSARSVSDGRAQRTQALATAGLFITSPGFAEDGGSNSSPKRPSLSRPANYSLTNKSANALQSDGKGTDVAPLYARTRRSRGWTRMFCKGISRWVVPAIITGVSSSL